MIKYRSLISQNFQTIINLKNLDICAIFKSAQLFPAFQGYVKYMNRSFPGMVLPCPYRSFRVINGSLQDPNVNESKKMFISPTGITIGNVFLIVSITKKY
jgi:hypothetical protein